MLTSQLNADRLTEHLWTGGDIPDDFEQAFETIEAWQRLGIDHIIDNRLECSDQAFVADVAPEIRYLHAGVDDRGQRMPDRWFDTVTSFAIDGIERGGQVLVHCHMGINRGPSAAYATLLATGWDPVEAIDLIRTARPIAAVGYAEDALDWWHRRSKTPQAKRKLDRNDLACWRLANPHDTVRIIRQIRNEGR